jgi:hypothetical protein
VTAGFVVETSPAVAEGLTVLDGLVSAGGTMRLGAQMPAELRNG